MIKFYRIFLIAVPMIFGMAISLYAAGHKEKSFEYEVRIGVASYQGALFGRHDRYQDNSYNNSSISDIYADYYGKEYSTGAFTAEFAFIVKKWLTVSMNLAYNQQWRYLFSNKGTTQTKIGIDKFYHLGLIPEARFTYLNRPNIRLYSGVGLGIGYELKKGNNNGNVIFSGDTELSPVVSVIPFGLSFGRTIFGFAELQVGTFMSGTRVGIGYRF